MPMEREVRGGLAAVAGAAALGLCLSGPATANPFAPPTASVRYEPSPEEWRKAVAEVMTYIRRDYLGTPPADPPPTEAGPDALRQLASRLDHQSQYIDMAGFERLREPQRIGLGVGLVVSPAYGAILTSVPPGSPGARAGLRVGDRLLAVNDAAAADAPEDELRRQLQPSTPGPLTLRIERAGATRSFTAEPDIGAQSSLRGVELRGAVGYVAVNSLKQGFADELGAALAQLLGQRRDLAGVVLDLRGCPGGLLDEVAPAAAVFLGPGPVFRQHARDGEKLVQAKRRSRDLLAGRPVVVLIDSATASGAEALAGTLQERGRARLLGTRTFGRGLTQTIVPLVGGLGGAFKLTTGELQLPSGARFHRRGIAPDLPVAASATDLDPNPRYHLREEDLPEDPRLGLPAAPPPGEAAPEAPPTGYEGDFQLDRAMALLAVSQP